MGVTPNATRFSICDINRWKAAAEREADPLPSRCPRLDVPATASNCGAAGAMTRSVRRTVAKDTARAAPTVLALWSEIRGDGSIHGCSGRVDGRDAGRGLSAIPASSAMGFRVFFVNKIQQNKQSHGS